MPPNPGAPQAPAPALLETNQQFIEAYMVGLNHEMSRELLWRGYPTSRTGTYFRQFWDVRGRVAPSTPAEQDGLEERLDELERLLEEAEGRAYASRR